MARALKWRIGATPHSWVLQELQADGTWENTRWYSTLESLARHLLEDRARARVAKGTELLGAVVRATEEVVAAVRGLDVAAIGLRRDLPPPRPKRRKP